MEILLTDVQIMPKLMQKGDEVSFTYWHHLNASSAVKKTKYGIIVSSNQNWSRVQFERNKGISRIATPRLKQIIRSKVIFDKEN